jgi:nitrogen fixation protein FixH
MSGLLLSLAVGCGLVALTNLLLGRWLGRQRAAVATALLTLLVYLPTAVVAWPGADVFTIRLAMFLLVSLSFGLTAAEGGRRRLHWVPLAFILFFAVVAAVNAVLVTVAERGLPGPLAALLLPESGAGGAMKSTFPGTVVPGMGRREQFHDRYLERLDAQRELGWQIRHGWQRTPRAGETAVFIVELTDRQGVPLEGAELRGYFLRPSGQERDQPFSMRAAGPGRYQADLVLPDPGLWQLLLTIRKGSHLHEMRGTTSVAAADVRG